MTCKIDYQPTIQIHLKYVTWTDTFDRFFHIYITLAQTFDYRA